MSEVNLHPYQQSYRRLLIDTQIPDWDPALLARYDAATAVAAAASAGATALMFYTQSHTGLAHYPAQTGPVHAALRSRDVLAATLEAAHQRGLPVCGYYSVNFNNWAALAHAEWRLAPVTKTVIGGGLLQADRYGICCMNHPGYRDFVHRQVDEILGRYAFDAFFFDMMWWMGVCLCESCRDRYRAETGAQIPQVVDWLDADWCRFQACRERWLTDFIVELRDRVRAVQPGIPVYHNFALALTNWTRAVSFGSAAGHDFLGGDFYGDRSEQLVVSRLMLNLSASRPVEFMTTITANLAEHERLKEPERLEQQVLAATTCGAAFLGIAAFDPDGCLNPAQVEHLGRAYQQLAAYESHLGGTPIEDVAVYFSDDSKMNFADNGQTLAAASAWPPLAYPHLRAVQGACRALQERHWPFGVITRQQLDSLDRHRVLVLPNVLRMDRREVEAIRTWVDGGGCLYASRLSSLTTVDGTRHRDFLLADLFGCSFESIEDGAVVYAEPADQGCREAIAPQRSLPHWLDRRELSGSVRLAPKPAGRTLMTLTLPFGHPSRGSAEGRDWASIHSFPPWTHSAIPTVVEQQVGRGRVIYSAADIEAGESSAHAALFLHLVGRLLGPNRSFEADAHPCVWMSAFDQPDRSRWVVSLLNYQEALPVIPLSEVRLRLLAPASLQFTTIRQLPEARELPVKRLAAGAIEVTLPRLERHAMIAADYRNR